MFCGLALAHAQTTTFNGGWSFCEKPNSASPDFNVFGIGELTGDVSPMIWTSFGIAGSIGYQNCIYPNYSMVVEGRYGFASGSTGSIQSSRDDFMMLNFAMPFEPGNSSCYTVIDVNNKRFLFGNGGPWELAFRGVSDRYLEAEQVVSGVDVNLHVDVIGDAARYDYVLTNQTGSQAPIGLWQGAWMYLLDNNLNQKGGLDANDSPDNVFISIPNQRTPNIETIYTRSANPSVFPPSIDIDWSQVEPYGLRIETGPSPSTTDPVTGISDATQADVLMLGFHGETSTAFLLEDIRQGAPNMPANTFPIVHTSPGIQQSDLDYTDNPAYVLKYLAQPVAVNGTREIVQYFRDTWGQSNYAPPYSVVIDAPHVLNYDPNGLNGLTPNPSTIRVWVDNTRGFSTAEQEIPLQNVRITLDLTNTNGMTIVGGGKTQTKTIARIESRRMASVDFQVQADGIATGIQPLAVEVVAPPGPTKTVSGTIDISTTPKLPVVGGSNLVAFPWTFSDSSLDTIFGLTQPTQYQAFSWDPSQQGYVLATSAQRGVGTWLVVPNPSLIPQGYFNLNSNPTLPTDMATGEGSIALAQGWNLIGNPYPYPIPLGDLIGVPAGDPTHTYKWVDLVGANFVSPSMAFWDTTQSPPSYNFISGADAEMQPNTGYWIFVTDLGLTLEFPPVFLEGANVEQPAQSSLRPKVQATPFVQSSSMYRLQLTARTQDEVDDKNYIGKADSAKDATAMKIYKPPMAPKASLALSIASDKPGETRLAQSLLDNTGPMQWTIYVQNVKQQQVTLTWPNMSQVPKNVAFRITDVATGTSRNMRQTSGYTFTAAANTSRQFTVQATAGTASKAIIGNVVVSQGKGLDRNAPFTISYTLSADATTTIRILGANGQEVYTATRGRADVAGENTATWAMRDNANRAVAPGIYRVEITAETTDGERVRKIVPVNVIR